MAALLALLSAVSFGVSDFGGGLATRRSSAPAVVLVSNGLSLVLAVGVAVLLPGSRFVATDLAWGAAAGSVGLVGVLLLYRGLAIGPMSVIAPLTAVLSALIPVVVGVVRGERPGPAALAGVVIAVPAIALICRQQQAAGAHVRVTPAGFAVAIGAGVGFGTFYVLLAQSTHSSLAWPLVGQRAASVLIVLLIVVAFRRGRSAPPRGATLGLAALAGVTDFAANLAYVTATHLGLLALVAVLSSFYPATTVLLAGMLLGERLTRSQLVGLLLAAAAVALIAVR